MMAGMIGGGRTLCLCGGDGVVHSIYLWVPGTEIVRMERFNTECLVLIRREKWRVCLVVMVKMLDVFRLRPMLRSFRFFEVSIQILEISMKVSSSSLIYISSKRLLKRFSIG